MVAPPGPSGRRLAEIDAELRIYLAPETVAATDALFEAARALGVPGTAVDV